MLVLSTFVSVGNARQPFHRLLDAITDLQYVLPKPIVVQHGHTVFCNGEMEAVDFVGMEQFLETLKSAQLLILHAGAGVVLQAIEVGQVPVVMPRREAFGECVDDHQMEFACAMERTGLIVVVDTPKELEVAVRRVINRPVSPALKRQEPRLIMLVREALRDVAVRV